MRALKLALTALATSRATERVKPLTPVQIDPGGSNHPLYTKQRASNPQTTGGSSKPSNGNDSLEQLLKAIKDNNVTLLAKSITNIANLDIVDNYGRTPLSVANRTGDLHTEIAKLLSEKESHNEAEELKKLMLSFFFAFVIVSCLYNEDRRNERNERNNVLRREYIEQLENSPVGKLSDQQFSRILNDDMKTLICTISHECLSATNVLAVDGNPNSLYSVDGLSQWLNPKAEANNGTKFHRIDAEGKFRDIYTKNICNIKDVINVTEAISKAFLERVSPIIQSLARGYITRKELGENDLDGSITPIEADDDPANAVGYAAKELERRKAGGGVEAQLE